MTPPIPTPIYRLIHIDNLEIILQRGAMHASNHVPQDGLVYRTIHNLEIQAVRRVHAIPCGPGGTIHDYVPFYFGARSPMLLQLHSGQVEGYNQGQEPLIYLVSTAQDVQQQNLGFVFSDGHGIAAFTQWFDDLAYLNNVDWEMVNARYWADTLEDMDRQRRKQAEFLVHQSCPLSLVWEIGVLNQKIKNQVDIILQRFNLNPIAVNIHPDWYY